MHKKLIVILLTVLVFLSAALVGVTSVYQVEDVAVKASVVTEVAKSEAEALQVRLKAAYEKQVSFFADEDEAEEILADFPYFRMVSFTKSYPDKIIIEVKEDAEVYAVPSTTVGMYYILGADGTVLGIRESYVNRLDGAENVLLKGLSVTGEKGSKLTGDDCFSTMLAIGAKMAEMPIELRRNVVSIEVFTRTPETIFKVSMREGVAIYIGEPNTRTSEKTEAAVNKYLSLSDTQKLTGRIVVSGVAGELIVVYSEKDEFNQ